jgi:hypothetical protein
VRSGSLWFAVKRATSRGDFPKDLRYDFGLVAFKREGGAGWADVVPIRPRTDRRRDSAGPRLGGDGFPHGTRLRVADNGTVTVEGGWIGADGDWLRRDVEFVFAPDGDGVRLTWPARAGDRFDYSVLFVDDGSVPQVTATSVSDGRLRAACDALDDVAFEDGYASGDEPKLIRARLSLRAPAAGPVAVSVRPA